MSACVSRAFSLSWCGVQNSTIRSYLLCLASWNEFHVFCNSFFSFVTVTWNPLCVLLLDFYKPSYDFSLSTVSNIYYRNYPKLYFLKHFLKNVRAKALVISIKFLFVISMLCKAEWSWELQTWSHKMNLLDISLTSPHYFYGKWMGATNKNSNVDLTV